MIVVHAIPKNLPSIRLANCKSLSRYNLFSYDTKKLCFLSSNELGYCFLDIDTFDVVVLDDENCVIDLHEQVYGMVVVNKGETPTLEDCKQLLGR